VRGELLSIHEFVRAVRDVHPCLAEVALIDGVPDAPLLSTPCIAWPGDIRSDEGRVEQVAGSANRGTGRSLVAREAELAALARFLDATLSGPAVLVLEGEAGIGKTTLWEAGVEAARARPGWVLACRPAEAEAKLGYAALGDLLETVPMETLAELPEPQQSALEIALLRVSPGQVRADARAVSVAVLNVLRALAGRGGVIVAIDDVQWLDAASARALEFAFRRLEREPVGVLASLRVGEPALAIERLCPGGFDRVNVGPFGRADLDQILRERANPRLPRHTLDRIHRLSGGNPFYALEIAHSLAGEEPLADELLAVPQSLRDLAAERVAAFPLSTRRALLAASALAAPTIPAIARATGRRDDRVPALAKAEAAGIVEIDGGSVRFTHPLLASGVYGQADAEERRRLHRRLARIVSADEESARHLALSADGPDASVADALEAAARSASVRGASDEAASLGELACRLTPTDAMDDLRRRQVETAEYHAVAGDSGRARQLAEGVATSPPANVIRARALHLLAGLTAGSRAVLGRLERARVESGDDHSLAARVESSLVEQFMKEFDAESARVHALAALEHATRAGQPGLRASALMDVAWSEFYLGHGISSELVQEALDLERFCDPSPLLRLPTLRYAFMLHLSHELESARSVYEELIERATAQGDEPGLARVFGLLSEVECWTGRYELAAKYAHASYRMADQCDRDVLRGAALNRVVPVETLRGRIEEARNAAAELEALTDRTEDIHAASASAWVLVFLDLSLGNPQAVVDRVRPLAPRLVECSVVEPKPTLPWAPDLIEALVALGELDEASFYAEALERRGRATGRTWALALAARSRALVEAARSSFDEALAAAGEALRQHEHLPIPFERARTLLVQGVVLRRAKQRRAARRSLSEALGVFEELGAPLWVERARAELARIGGRSSGDELTPTEAQVAARAAAGETNREVAEALFMSVKTVEANLSRVYRKLDISSRRQLGRSLDEAAAGEGAPGQT